MKVAIVHEWLASYAGAERVVEQMLQVFPEADVFAVVDFMSEKDRSFLRGRKVQTTFIQRLPGAKKHFRSYLALMPIAIEQLDVSGYDLVLSSSHAVAKGVLTGPNQFHISYVHSPVRYAWDLTHQYLAESGLTHGVKSWAARLVLHYIRLWDVRTANGVDRFLANSRFIARRIKKVYGRSADVIYPPVDVDSFPMEAQKDDYYLTASRMVPYKKVRLVVEAFNAMPEKKLVVIGDGSEYRKIQAAAGPNIMLLGYQPNAVLKEKMQHARAFVFAAEEDFGITPVEAQACGTPVIAYGRGGALETVVPLGRPAPTGLFFSEQTPESICEAIHRFECHDREICAENCRQNAEQFSTERFCREFYDYVMSAYEAWQKTSV